MKNTKTPASTLCPCNSAKSYAACCAPYLEGLQPAPTAEALMRSRYTAYARCNADYLLATWHASTRPALLEMDAESNPQWIRLEIKNRSAESTDGTHATVEFIATFKTGGRAHRLHETSSFLKENGQWYYVDGVIH